MLATELAAALELDDQSNLRHWLQRLLELQLVRHSGRTRATRYFVDPALLQEVGLDRQTTLRRIEPHRLQALIEEDVLRYPGSSSSEIHQRIGPEIPARTLSRAIEHLLTAERITPRGDKRWRRYYPPADGRDTAPDGG
jgi:ATP-dependent DNA helicase RecG